MSVKKPCTNPEIVFREEFDDWAILFDPSSGEAYGINPVGALIWKKLDGKRTVEEIVSEVQQDCDHVTPEASAEIESFIDDLTGRGFIAM